MRDLLDREPLVFETGPAQVRKGVTESSGFTALDLEYVESLRRSGGAKLLLARATRERITQPSA